MKLLYNFETQFLLKQQYFPNELIYLIEEHLIDIKRASTWYYEWKNKINLLNKHIRYIRRDPRDLLQSNVQLNNNYILNRIQTAIHRYNKLQHGITLQIYPQQAKRLVYYFLHYIRINGYRCDNCSNSQLDLYDSSRTVKGNVRKRTQPEIVITKTSTDCYSVEMSDRTRRERKIRMSDMKWKMDMIYGEKKDKIFGNDMVILKKPFGKYYYPEIGFFKLNLYCSKCYKYKFQNKK